MLAPANGFGRGYGLPVPEGVEEWRVPDPDPVKAMMARSVTQQQSADQTANSSLKRLLKAAYRSVLFPDRDILWALRAIRFARKRLQHRPDIHALLSSSSGASKHWAAAQLKRWTGLPWVADLHDPWAADSPAERPRSRLRAALEQRLERSLLARADQITTVGASYIPRLCIEEPRRSEIRIIPGGYDPDHFADLPAAPPPASSDTPFRIAHAGTLYGGQRDPTPLFRAAKRLLDQGISPKIEILLIGPAEPAVQALAEAEGVAGLVRFTGYVPHRRSLELLADSHVLALLGTPQGYEVPSKLYEYLAIGRPILALWRPGADVGRIIAAARAGAAIPPDEIERIAHYIADLCRSWQAGDSLPTPDRTYVAGLTRRAATRGLAAILDTLVPDRIQLRSLTGIH